MNNEKIIITTFTDPMMGLSYECQPIFRKLETHFSEKIEFKYIMSGLVRNVYALVDPLDLAKSEELAIKNYNQKLANIYESEESISKMPVNMNGFALFDTEHTSSLPLNLAYKAAQIADKEKSDLFLYNLRYATIVDCRPTTHINEILNVARKTYINKDEFLKEFNGESAKKALEEDFKLAQSLNIRSLPTYLIEYKEKKIIIQSLIDYPAFVSVIDKITNANIKPKSIESTQEELKKLLKNHPLISPVEIMEALDLPNINTVSELIQPQIDNGLIVKRNVYHGWFIEKK